MIRIEACVVDRLPATDFRPASPPQPLAQDEIHLWFYPSWAALPAAESTPIRRTLSAYLGVAERELRLCRDAHGKPRLVGETLAFNLAHSGGALLLAIGRRPALGVDLELPRRRRPVLRLARRFFHPTEVQALASLARASRPTAFLGLWCVKEAILKAEGTGLGGGLARVVVTLDGAGVPRAVARPDADSAEGWHCLTLTPPAIGAVGALAWRGAPCAVRAFLAPCADPTVASARQSS